MDKETLSNYGWIVICILVLSVMIAMATPFGTYIKTAVENTTEGLFNVQQKAMGVAGLVVDDQKFENNGSQGIEPPLIVELTSLTAITWDGTNNIDGIHIWTDGNNIYHSYRMFGTTTEHKLNNGRWELINWNISTSGFHIWSDGANTYYSYESDQYMLNGDIWEVKTWNGLTNFSGSNIWTDGTNIYYSNSTQQYVLNGDTWEVKNWNGFQNICGQNVWTDGTNIYYSSGSNQYVLNGDTWEAKTWNKSIILGEYIWTDGLKTYYSQDSSQYVLNGDTWEVKTWNGLTNFYGSDIWTDGKNYYYSEYSDRTIQYIFS